MPKRSHIPVLLSVLCLLVSACSTKSSNMGDYADAAMERYHAKVAESPDYREQCTVDNISISLPAKWFEIPLTPGASPAAKHFYAHTERTAESGSYPFVRVFLYPPEVAERLFVDEKSFNAFAENHILMYENARLVIDPEERVIRHVYKCLSPEMGRPVFRCSTIIESANGVVEVQYTDDLAIIKQPDKYYIEVEELMTSIKRQ